MNSLKNKALLVHLSISQWSGTRIDKSVSKEVEQLHNTELAGRYEKALIAKDSIKEIRRKASDIRTFHYENTLPWADGGVRILPSANYLDYTQEMKQLKEDWESEVRRFIKNYDSMIEEARQRLNGMFNELDYPEHIDSLFAVHVEFTPIPDSADFRVSIDESELEQIKNTLQTSVAVKQEQAVIEIFKRVYKVVSHIVDKLSDSESIFRDTLIENVEALIDLLPKLNITDDTEIDTLISKMKDLVVDPDQLRTNQVVRNETAKKAQSILDTFGVKERIQ